MEVQCFKDIKVYPHFKTLSELQKYDDKIPWRKALAIPKAALNVATDTVFIYSIIETTGVVAVLSTTKVFRLINEVGDISLGVSLVNEAIDVQFLNKEQNGESVILLAAEIIPIFASATAIANIFNYSVQNSSYAME